MFFIDAELAALIVADAALQVAEYTAILAEISANDGNPVEWTDDSRLDMMKLATLSAFRCGIDVACYPLSVSAVVFIP